MIEVLNLSKSFGALKAVNGVSFEAKKGEVLPMVQGNPQL